MKVEVKEQPEKNPLKFPCLMRYDDDTNIILLVTEIKGIDVLGTQISPQSNTGSHSKTWISDNLVMFNGKITLSND